MSLKKPKQLASSWKARDWHSTKYNVDKPVVHLSLPWVQWLSSLPESPGSVKESIFCYCLALAWNVQWLYTRITPTGFSHMDCNLSTPALQVIDTSLSGWVPIYTADTQRVTHDIFLKNGTKTGKAPSNTAPRTLRCLAVGMMFSSPFVSFTV